MVNNSQPEGRINLYVWVILVTLGLLSVPLVAMLISDEVAWSFGDFVAMGSMIVVTGSLIVWMADGLSKKQAIIGGLVVLSVFFFLWAELSVGLIPA